MVSILVAALQETMLWVRVEGVGLGQAGPPDRIPRLGLALRLGDGARGEDLLKFLAVKGPVSIAFLLPERYQGRECGA